MIAGRELVSAALSLGVVIFGTLACGAGSSGTSDAGPVTTAPVPPGPARGARKPCGNTRDGQCAPGEVCLIDSPSCHDASGFCAPPSPPCAVSIPYCGCGVTQFACTFPTIRWMQRGADCLRDASAPTDGASSP